LRIKTRKQRAKLSYAWWYFGKLSRTVRGASR
jgi:hypothetical protein